ncbi:MKL/myocardin-like protein 2 isoform X2 [Cimex lectularius]|nr:MKL/myocardin-like protein 2 isoform X2 [Cimex lectularius]XP_014243286.1 MKL/myocardin-like protein 2 isoform X2 [Cimex lectularius]
MEPSPGVDESPLHSHMDKNKESLKVKLMLRRPINQLVAQGIMPPLKTPPGFHEQRQKLERAKMGDLLKAKIQQRPDREELVRQHILEDVGHVDPSLAERQRMLKKCRLADSLNDQLSHRPGPLELIKKNILHTEEPIERAIKEGALEFKATSEGTATKPTHPDHYMLDEDSGGSLSPPPSSTSVQNSPATPQPAPTPVVIAAAPASDETLVTSSTSSPMTNLVTVLLPPNTAFTLPAAAVPSFRQATVQQNGQQASQVSSSSLKDKARKKSKSKVLPKARTIKFHEYKGPPNAQKNSQQSSSSIETSYELLLQQQQLFLQWQLEWQHKYPQILLPASQKPVASPSSSSNGGSSIDMSPAPPPPPPPLPHNSPPPPLRNLEDMKVSDLKAELKRRNLPVSGAKPQLIERLKPFSESANGTSSVTSTVQSSSQEDSVPSVCSVTSSGQVNSTIVMDTTESPVSPPSPASIGRVSPKTTQTQEEEIIKEQQRKIDQLERQLSHHIQNNTFQQQTVTNAKANLAAFLQQQQLNHQQQQLQQQIIANNNNNNIIKMEKTEDNRTVSLPNFIGTFMTNGLSDLVSSDDIFDAHPSKFDVKTENKQAPLEQDVKSQIVDDVLEILIKNGELPASAAAEPLELSSLQMEGMDVDQDLMEIDTDWLDSLISGGNGGCTTGQGDPFLGGPPSPQTGFDLFIDDPEFKVVHSNPDWDRIDFAI